jgi:hypothetical protein
MRAWPTICAHPNDAEALEPSEALEEAERGVAKPHVKQLTIFSCDRALGRAGEVEGA